MAYCYLRSLVPNLFGIPRVDTKFLLGIPRHKIPPPQPTSPLCDVHVNCHERLLETWFSFRLVGCFFSDVASSLLYR